MLVRCQIQPSLKSGIHHNVMVLNICDTINNLCQLWRKISLQPQLKRVQLAASHKRYLFFGDLDERYRPSPEYEGGKSNLLTVSVSYDSELSPGSE